MEQTKGVIPEFVNPKYADETRTTFKSATRLECMMQDYPKLLEEGGKVGFTNYDIWFCFSPAKNNLKDAAICQQKGLPPFSANMAEYDFYEWANKIMELAGTQIERNQIPKDYGGVKVAFGPMVLLHPSYGLT